MVDVDEVNEISTTHDALFLTLSLSNIMAVTTSVGSSETLTGTIVGGGNGCVEELVLMTIDDAGLTTTELRVEGNTIAADSMNGDTMYFTITQAEISQVGDMDDCFDALEMLNFERDVDISSCEVDAHYQSFWGCDSERCIFTALTPHQVNIAFEIPEINYTGGATVQASNLCDTAIISHTFRNDGNGIAYNVRYKSGFGASGNVLSGNTSGGRKFPVVQTCIGDSVVSFLLSGPEAGLVVYTDSLTGDPDGPGGLDDIDGDGFFDDLPVGESFTVTLKHLPLPEPNCPANRSSGSYKVTTCYTDQCEDEITPEIVPAHGTLSDFTSDGPGSVSGPSDINDGDIFTLNVCGNQRFGGTMLSCTTDTMLIQVTVPAGFSLVSATVMGAPLGSVSQSNDTIRIAVDFGSNADICADITLELDCDFYTGDTGFDIKYIYICDENCDERETFSCPVYAPLVHCPEPCPHGGLTVRSTAAYRSTIGFLNPMTCDEYADPAGLSEIQLKRAMPCDTVCLDIRSEQIAGIYGYTFDNAHLRIQYNPTSMGASSNLSFAGGMLELVDVSDGMTYTCDIPTPTDMNINNGGGDDLHIMEFDLTSCLDLLPGDTLSGGDSVNFDLKVIVEKQGSLDNDVPTQLEDIEIRTYNIQDTVPMDGMDEEITCDRYGLELYLHEPANGGGGGLTNRIVNGCNSFSGYKTFPWSGSEDWYPGEIRPNYKLDSVVISFTSCDSLDFESVVLRAEGSSADGYGAGTHIADSLGTPDNIIITPTNKRYVWYNDGTWPLGDMNGRFNAQGGYSLLANYFSSCLSKDGNLSMGFYAQRFGYSHDTDCYEGANNIGTVLVNHTNPSTAISDQTGLVQVSRDTVCWSVEVQNVPNVNGGYFFIGFEDALVNAINVIELLDVDADTLIPLMAYVDGDWGIIDMNFPPSSAKEYKITAVLEDCGLDSVKVVSGFECTEPMNDPSNYPCDLDSTYLSVVPLDSRVQIELAQEAAPYDICTEIDDTITVTSALDAYITDLLLCIPVPNGLTENDLMAVIEYPKESGDMQMVPITFVDDPVRDTAYIDIMQHSVIAMQNGIPGTQDANTAEEAIVDVFVTWITDCEFTVGETYEAYVYANRPCGSPAIDNGVSTVSDPLTIVGVDPPFLSVIEPMISTDTIEGCQPEELMLSSTIIVGQSTDNDSIFITLPEGTSYTDGSYMCTIAPPGDTACPVFVEVREIGGLDQVVLSIPAGIGNVTELTFDLGFMAEPGDACNENRIITIDAISSVGGIFCPTTGMNCSNLQVLTGQATDTIFFKKSEVNFDVIEVCTENDMYLISGELAVDSVDVVANDSIVIEVFCSSDLSGSIATIVFNGPIVAGTVLPISEQLAASCPEGDQMYFKVDPGSGNCICTLVDTLVDINPPIRSGGWRPGIDMSE